MLQQGTFVSYKDIMEIKRNSQCWCGSGKKYKACHEEFDKKLNVLRFKGNIIPERALIKSDAAIKGIRKSGKINTAVLDYVAAHIKAGITTEEIDQMVMKITKQYGAIPAQLHYNGYPKSVCVSINDQVCHGIPDEQTILKEGDIVNVDCTTIFHGYYADASRMFIIGEASEEAKRLVQVTKECLELGIASVKPWCHVGDIGDAIYRHASKNGYSVVVDFCGHGVGNDFHEDPFVMHMARKGTGMILAPGMVFTIEPMINAGDYQIVIDESNGWTAYTKDHSLSAQWEHTLLVTERGVEIITK